MKYPRSKRLQTAMYMEPKSRKPVPGIAYQRERDELYHWIIRQPQLINFLISMLQRWGYIQYDKQTRTWKGAAYED